MANSCLLLVDGDAKSLRVLEVSLKKAGFNILTASTGIDALQRASDCTPDLVISDTDMPEMNGYAFCKEFKQNSDWAGIPFIFLTKESSIENKIKGLELGVDDYLTKPIYIKEILTRVRILLQKRERSHVELKKEHNTRFAGQLNDMGVVDLIQTIEVSRKTGVIYFKQDDKRQATIFFKDGKVIDAETGHLAGAEAVYRILTWNKGEFEALFRPVRRRDIVEMSSQALLMEGMRRLDEWGRLQEQLPPMDKKFEIAYEELWERLAELPDDLNTVLRLFDTRKTLSEVVDGSAMGDLEVVEIISKLYFEGIIVEVGKEIPKAVPAFSRAKSNHENDELDEPNAITAVAEDPSEGIEEWDEDSENEEVVSEVDLAAAAAKAVIDSDTEKMSEPPSSDLEGEHSSSLNETVDTGADSETDFGADSETDSGTVSETDSGTDSETDFGADSDTDSGADSETDFGADKNGLAANSTKDLLDQAITAATPIPKEDSSPIEASALAQMKLLKRPARPGAAIEIGHKPRTEEPEDEQTESSEEGAETPEHEDVLPAGPKGESEIEVSSTPADDLSEGTTDDSELESTDSDSNAEAEFDSVPEAIEFDAEYATDEGEPETHTFRNSAEFKDPSREMMSVSGAIMSPTIEESEDDSEDSSLSEGAEEPSKDEQTPEQACAETTLPVRRDDDEPKGGIPLWFVGAGIAAAALTFMLVRPSTSSKNDPDLSAKGQELTTQFDASLGEPIDTKAGQDERTTNQAIVDAGSITRSTTDARGPITPTADARPKVVTPTQVTRPDTVPVSEQEREAQVQLLIKNARRAKQSGDRFESLQIIDESLALRKSSTGLLFKAELLMEIGDSKSAAGVVEELTRVASRRPKVWRLKGYVAKKNGDREGAKSAFARYLKMSPSAKDAAEIQKILQGL